MAERLYGFHKDTAARLRRIAERDAGTPQPGLAVTPPALLHPNCRCYVVQTSGPIAGATFSMSGLTPGYGTAILLEYSEDDELLVPSKDQEDEDVEVTIYNLKRRLLSSGTICVVVQEMNGLLIIVESYPQPDGSSGSICVTHFADDVPFSDVPGYEEGVWQQFLHDDAGCGHWVTPSVCLNPGSSSGSDDSSSDPDSSSSAPPPDECIYCDEDIDGLTITTGVFTFWDYAHSDRYGSESSLVFTFDGFCTASITFPKLSGGGNQTWTCQKLNATTFRVVCYDADDGDYISIWDKTVAAGNCCPTGSFTFVSHSLGEGIGMSDLSIASTTGGPC